MGRIGCLYISRVSNFNPFRCQFRLCFIQNSLNAQNKRKKKAIRKTSQTVHIDQNSSNELLNGFIL